MPITNAQSGEGSIGGLHRRALENRFKKKNCAYEVAVWAYYDCTGEHTACDHAAKAFDSARLQLVLHPKVAWHLEACPHARPYDCSGHAAEQPAKAAVLPIDRAKGVQEGGVVALSTDGESRGVCLHTGLDKKEGIGECGLRWNSIVTRDQDLLGRTHLPQYQ